jgi:hypothetical protein
MSARFVTTLRSRPDVLRLGGESANESANGQWTVRVQMPDVWDAVKVETPSSESVVALKVAALAALYPEGEFHEDFVMKLHGFEVLDENATLADVGAQDGSIFLVTFRRRRPVR